MIIYNEEKKELIIPTGIGNIDNTIYYDEGFTDGYSSGRTDGYHEGYGIGYGSGWQQGYNSGYTEGYADAWLSAHTYNIQIELDCDSQTMPRNVPILINGEECPMRSATGTYIDNIWALFIDTTILSFSAITECIFRVTHRAEVFDIYGMKINGHSTNILDISKEKNDDTHWTVTIEIEPFSIDPYQMGYEAGLAACQNNENQ